MVGLVDFDHRARFLPRANGEFGLVLQVGDKDWEHLDGDGKVGIGKKEEVAIAKEHPLLHGLPFSQVSRLTMKLERWMFAKTLLNDLCGSVSAAIVNDDDLKLVGLRIQKPQYPF
jgi:hypothetical protein